MLAHSHTRHEILINSAKAVSSAYLALNLARNFYFTHEEKQTNLTEILRSLGHRPDTETTIRINQIDYHFTSLPSSNEQRAENPGIKYFQISRVGGNKAEGIRRQSSEYDGSNSEDIDEVMSIFTNAPIGIQADSDSPSLLLTAGDKEISLGGRDKEDLYPSHLSVIDAIIQHLHDPDALAKNLNNLLIAYPTGSGKTFIQAIWFLILYHARISGVFALPENSIHQYISDFKRLLPASLVAEIVSINKTLNKANITNTPESDHPRKDKGELHEDDISTEDTAVSKTTASEKLPALNIPTDKPCYFVGSHQDALSTYFTSFIDINNLVFCIDEEHKAVEIEAQKIAIHKLAENNLCMFLTATPDEATYKVCGKPVAIMSQKAFSEIHVIRAKSLDDYRKETKSGRAIVMAIADAIEPMPVSTAAAILTELPYVVANREIAGKEQSPHRQARWNFTTMLSRRALVCASESVDDLINFSRFAHNTSSNHFELAPSLTTKLYSEGNVREREYSFHVTRQDIKDENGRTIGTADRDIEHATAYLSMKKKKLEQVTPAVIQENKNLEIPLTIHESADNSIFHGLNEIFVRGVLAYDPNPAVALSNFKKTTSQYLNERRLNNLEALTKEFKYKLAIIQDHNRDSRQYFKDLLTYHHDHNTAGIDAEGASKSATLLNSMLEASLIANEGILPNIVDNWNLDISFKNLCLQRGFFKANFNNFTNEHRTVFIMSGMDEAETPIESGRPFKKFKCEYVPIRNDDGSFNESAKKRTLNMTEYFDPTACELHFTPEYYDSSMTEFLIDNYFRLGLKGFLVSNRKSEAFNDRGLTNVISLIAHNGDKNNKPSQVVQQIGRNRDLDKTQISIVAQVYAKDANPVLDAAALKTTRNFLPDLFKAERRFKKFLIVKLGKGIAAEIKSWFIKSTDGKEQVEPALFRKTVLKSLLEKMRSLNIQNDHRLNQTKSDFAQSIKIAQQSFRETIDKLKHSFTKNFIVKAIYNISLIVAAFFSLRRIKTAVSFYRKASANKKVLAAMDVNDANYPKLRLDVAYAKVIRAHSLNETYQQNMIGLQFTRVLGRKIKILKNTVIDNPMPLLAEDAISLINNIAKEYLLPLLVRFFSKDQQARLLSIAQGYTGWENIINKLRNDFPELQTLTTANMKAMSEPLQKMARAMFAAVPELADEVESMQQIDYIQSAADAKSNFQNTIEDLTNDHTYLLNQIEMFLTKSFLNNIEQCMPVRYSALIRHILNDGKNAAEFAAILVKERLSSHHSHAIDFNLENSFEQFKNQFIKRYPALEEIDNMEFIKINAENKLTIISNDLNKIMLDQDPTTIQPASAPPVETSKAKQKIAQLKQSFGNKLTKGKAVVHFVTKRSDIKDTLTHYFNTDFLDNMTHVLPKAEYDIIAKIFSNRDHCHTFAAYLYRNARRIQQNGTHDSNIFIDLLKDCFKNSNFSVSLNEFRTTDEIQQSLVTVTNNISKDLTDIADEYTEHKRQEFILHFTNLFKQVTGAAYLAEILHLTGTGLQPNETIQQAIMRLMSQPNEPNAASFACFLVQQYEAWQADSNNTNEPPFDHWFNKHFSEQDKGIEYKTFFMHTHAERGFNALIGLQSNITDFIDFTKFSELARTHIGELLMQPDVVKLVKFYLKDLNEDDIAAILSQNDTKGFEKFKPEAEDLIVLKNAISTGKINAIPLEFFMPSHGTELADLSDDSFTRKISSTRLYRASQNLTELIKAVTNYQCHYHCTKETGGARYYHPDAFNPNNIQTIQVPPVEVDSIGDLCWSLNFMNAQLKSAPAQDRLNAFADKYTIDSYQRASEHMIQPFSAVFNASKLGHALWRGLKSIGSSIKQIFNRNSSSIQAEDTAVSVEVAASIQQRTPLTWAKVHTHLQKHAREPNRRPHQDAIEKTIQKLDAVTKAHTKPVSFLTKTLFPENPSPPVIHNDGAVLVPAISTN